MPPTFRTGTAEDIEQLRTLGLSAYGQLKHLLSEEHWQIISDNVSNADTYLTFLAKGTCFVCEENGEITGMAYFIPQGNPTPIFQEDWCYLRLVGVHPAHAGKGIGKKLTELCLEQARKTNEKTIALHTSDFMDAARHIYEHLGFKVLKELEPRFGKRYWVYTLELE